MNCLCQSEGCQREYYRQLADYTAHLAFDSRSASCEHQELFQDDSLADGEMPLLLAAFIQHSRFHLRLLNSSIPALCKKRAENSIWYCFGFFSMV